MPRWECNVCGRINEEQSLKCPYCANAQPEKIEHTCPGTIRRKCRYWEFASFVSCMFAEGVEFMDKKQLLAAIKAKWGELI